MTDNDGPEFDRWRDLLKPTYDYPEADTDGMKGRARRKATRVSKRDHRGHDKAARKEFIQEFGRREGEKVKEGPGTAITGIIIAVIVLVAIGAAVTFLIRSQEDPPIAAPTAPSSTTATTKDATEPIGTPGPGRPDPATLVSAEAAIQTWAIVFYTRTPATQTYGELLGKTSDHMTEELYKNLRDAGDSTYDALATDNATMTAETVSIAAPMEGMAPVDTDTRVTRHVTVTVVITGGVDDGSRHEIPMQIETAHTTTGWKVANVEWGEE